MEKFARPGDFCKFGKTRKGVQRYQCKTCSRTFTATAGTIFYRKRTPEHEILETLALLGRGQPYQQLESGEGS